MVEEFKYCVCVRAYVRARCDDAPCACSAVCSRLGGSLGTYSCLLGKGILFWASVSRRFRYTSKKIKMPYQRPRPSVRLRNPAPENIVSEFLTGILYRQLPNRLGARRTTHIYLPFPSTSAG